MRISLRNQLVLWFGLAVLAILLATTFTAEQMIERHMERSLDDVLRKHANFAAAVISSDVGPDEASYARLIRDLAQQEFPFVPLLLRIISPAGSVIAQFGQVPDQILGSLDRLAAPGPEKGRFDSLAPHGTSQLRAYTLNVSHPETYQTLAFVQAVESLEALEDAKRGLWRNALIVGLGGASLAMLAGFLLIRRGFRPLSNIVGTINQVDYSHLRAYLKEEARPLELQQLARSLTDMWQRLDMAVSQKQSLLGMISHDLRTPLTSLQGHLEVILMDPTLAPDVRDSLQRMLEETGRLIRMVRNLLLSFMLESAPKPAFQKVSLKQLLEEVVSEVWVLAKGLQVEISTPVQAFVQGDHDLLKQMLLNIVDNAIKFTAPGGRVVLALSADKDWATVEVSDTGVGIPAEILPHVTEAFYNSKSSLKHNGEGVWLGLSIVKQIAELHGGRIEIDSVEEVGTSVRVRLPVADGPIPGESDKPSLR